MQVMIFNQAYHLWIPRHGIEIPNDNRWSFFRFKQVLNFFKNYSSNNMILTVVGKSDFDTVCNLSEKLFKNLKNAQ